MEEYKEILVPVDGSDLSKNALAKALSLAENFGAKVTILHVHEPLDMNILGVTGEHEFLADYRKSDPLKNIVGPMMDEYRGIAKEAGKKIKTMIAEGNPADEIIKRSKKFDLVIMGTHGRSGLRHLLIGGVAEKVVRHAYCPVLLIREKIMD
ncbi:MAG: universal stress protein [Thermoplasmatota archaeon]